MPTRKIIIVPGMDMQRGGRQPSAMTRQAAEQAAVIFLRSPQSYDEIWPVGAGFNQRFLKRHPGFIKESVAVTKILVECGVPIGKIRRTLDQSYSTPGNALEVRGESEVGDEYLIIINEVYRDRVEDTYWFFLEGKESVLSTRELPTIVSPDNQKWFMRRLSWLKLWNTTAKLHLLALKVVREIRR